MIYTRKQKRIITVVARKNAIAITPFLKDRESSLTDIRQTTNDLFQWLTSAIEREIERLKADGQYADIEPVSIKYEAALNDIPDFLRAAQAEQIFELSNLLELAEQLYRISDNLEYRPASGEQDNSFDEAAQVRSEQTGIPMTSNEDLASDLYPQQAEDSDTPQTTGTDSEREAAAQAYNDYHPEASERAEVIEKVEETGALLGFKTRKALDEVVAKANDTYPGKSALDELSTEQLRKMHYQMDAALLRREAASS